MEFFFFLEHSLFSICLRASLYITLHDVQSRPWVPVLETKFKLSIGETAWRSVNHRSWTAWMTCLNFSLVQSVGDPIICYCFEAPPLLPQCWESLRNNKLDNWGLCLTDFADIVEDPWWQHKGKTAHHKIPSFLVWKTVNEK